MAGPLKGIKVVDAGAFGIGPWAASLLGLMGAEVIRIEPPSGDGVMYVGTPVGGMGNAYIASNFNKKSIVLDLTTEGGRELGLQLAAWADVFIENRRFGSTERLGLGYDVVSQQNPRIVYISVPAYGSKGPLINYASADSILQVVTGFASINGEEDGPAQIFRYMGHIDKTASAIICQAALLGLTAREVTGEGQKIETSGFQAGIALQASRIAEFFATGQNSLRLGSGSSTIVPSQAFRCLDGRYINVSVNREEFWPRLCRALEIEHMQDEPRFESNAQRVKHRAELVSVLEKRFSDKPAQWWLIHLQRHDVPCGINYTFAEVCHDPHVQFNQMIIDVETPWGAIKTSAPPWRFSRTPTEDIQPPPYPNADRSEIMEKIGQRAGVRAVGINGYAKWQSSATSGSESRCSTAPPLAGLKVIDLTDEIAGPYCTMQLGDSGAEVIKVERPEGDWSRKLGPKVAGESALFLALNRNKKSIVVDINKETGKQIIYRLASQADVFVESFCPTEAGRSGINYEDLKKINPRLIYCLITPFGNTGPYKDRPASELEIQGMCGYTWFLGEPGGAPVRVGADVAAINTGMDAFVGILAALLHRAVTGYGQAVEVSMLGTLLSTGAYWIGGHSNPDRYAGFYITGPYDHAETGYQTMDRPITFSLFLGRAEEAKKRWSEFAKSIGLGDLLSDPYWLDYGARLIGMGRDAQEQKPVLESAFATWAAEDLVALVNQLGGMAAVLYSYEDLFAQPHPQVVATEMVAEVEHLVCGRIKVTGLPWKLSRTPGLIKSAAPTLSQDSEAILLELGYTKAEFRKLKKARVVG